MESANAYRSARLWHGVLNELNRPCFIERFVKFRERSLLEGTVPQPDQDADSDSSHQGAPCTTLGTPWRSIFAVVPILILLALAIPGFPSKAKAQDWRRTTSSYPGMAPRKAIMFVSAPRSDTGRVAAALQAVAAYRSRLEDLGFDTLALGPASRPALDQAVREIPKEIQPGSEVTVSSSGRCLGQRRPVCHSFRCLLGPAFRLSQRRD
jgi:hypothetical protein